MKQCGSWTGTLRVVTISACPLAPGNRSRPRVPIRRFSSPMSEGAAREGRCRCWRSLRAFNQILTNLLTNAAKYTIPGGGICLAAEVAAGDVVLQVPNNGMGIAPDLLPRVFDLFQQGDGPGDRTCGGLGIGLALVKSLVELHGGNVSAFSGGPGTGSQFVVRLLDCAPNVQEGQEHSS